MRTLLAAALPLLLSACVLGQVGAVMHPTLNGALVVRAIDGAETRWTPDRCASGDLDYFLGFDFYSSQDSSRLRAIMQPTGNVIVRWRTITFGAADCEQLALEIAPTGWRVNEVREFAGHVDLQCRMPDGSTIAGRISVDHCH